jgi:MFS transporter, YNFM family, putative membrane transport protein
MAGFLLGSAGMFATMYSTQAILPELGRSFGVGPAHAGLSVSVVVAAIAAAVWLWGPLSDRIGRRRSLVLASGLLVVPSVAAAAAPTFDVLLACRAAQGLCMPGLLAVGVPYVLEAFGPSRGGRAMGAYVLALVAGGLIGRVGVALLAAASNWRVALGALAVLPAAATLVMRRGLPETEPPVRGAGLAAQLRNVLLLRIAVAAGALFFTFVGTFSYAVYRLERAPFDYGPAVSALIFLLWVLGVVGPWAGHFAERIGWRRAALVSAAAAALGLLLTLPTSLPTLVLGLALVTVAMFSGVTALQLGVGAAARVDRGAASAVYFSVYYASGAVGAYVPGLAWQAWHWTGVAGAGLAAVGVAGASLVSSRGTVSAKPRA